MNELKRYFGWTLSRMIFAPLCSILVVYNMNATAYLIIGCGLVLLTKLIAEETFSQYLIDEIKKEDRLGTNAEIGSWRALLQVASFIFFWPVKYTEFLLIVSQQAEEDLYQNTIQDEDREL
jgi:hypothetical protein